MKPYLASLINAVLLITIGLWGYISSTTPSPTALIPVIIGTTLLIFIKGIKQEKRIQAHIAVVLTILVFIGLFKPFFATFGRADSIAIVRVSIMLISTLYALILFVKSFIAARKSK